MKIDKVEIFGIEASMRGMRNPMDSWHLQDTKVMTIAEAEREENEYICEGTVIGPNDMKLAKKLIKAGPEHCKFLRQIQVWADIDMPRYWWSEFDTYKFNSKNSCSTMHKLFTKKEIIREDFVNVNVDDLEVFDAIIDKLNELRVEYLETKNYGLVLRGKKILPESFLQKRTVNTNYAELINIYHQRKNHRLKEEWQDTFCKWVESLPYMNEFLNCK